MSVFNRVRPIAALACGLMLSASFALQAASFRRRQRLRHCGGITEAQKPVLREFSPITAHIAMAETAYGPDNCNCSAKMWLLNVPCGRRPSCLELGQLAYYVAQN